MQRHRLSRQIRGLLHHSQSKNHRQREMNRPYKKQAGKYCYVVTEDWPRIRDLPESERDAFTEWLDGQTRPMIEGEDMSEQDAYYEHDYRAWKRGIGAWD